MIKEIKLTAAQERCLRDQVISTDQPGTVLRDFQMLLDFLQSRGGVAASGKYNLLPIKHLVELDHALSHPLNLKLKRPQLRSHPYLQGLHLLLRASGLGVVEGAGDKARLIVDPAIFMQWQQLNPTERYFNLLEAWLLFGRMEMIGEQGPRYSDQWGKLSASFYTISQRRTQLELYGDYYCFALMDLFGIAEVDPPKSSLAPGSAADIKPTAFGDAFVQLLLRPGVRRPLEEPGPEKVDEAQDEADASEEEVAWVPRFGAWQPIFQPYFPQWRENLVFEEPEPREGTFVFRVSLDKVERVIAMPSDSDLHELAMWILDSVNFDDDHLYEFTLRDRVGSEVEVSDARINDGDIFADQVRIGTLPLELGQSMTMLYDFGDDWRFTIKLERIEPPGAKIKAPRILEKRGNAPRQYPHWDDD